MHPVKIKRIYDETAKDDGYRILVDRLWPRGVSKEKANLDEWNKDLAPSDSLRKWFDHKEKRFDEFAERYEKELNQNSKELERIAALAKEKKITLLYAAKDEKLNQAVVLRKIIKNDN